MSLLQKVAASGTPSSQGSSAEPSKTVHGMISTGSRAETATLLRFSSIIEPKHDVVGVCYCTTAPLSRHASVTPHKFSGVNDSPNLKKRVLPSQKLKTEPPPRAVRLPCRL